MADLREAATNLWTWILTGGIGVLVAVVAWARSLAGDRATRDHVALEAARRAVAEEKLAQAEKQVDEQREVIDQLREQLAQAARTAEFHEEGGVLFKRRPGGGYHDVVYCTECKRPLVPVSGYPWCGVCKCYAPTVWSDIDGLRSRLSD